MKRIQLSIFSFCMMLSFGVIAQQEMSEGDWYKLSIQEKGIYKISYDYLENIGIKPNRIDPRQIRLYGVGGDPLPQSIGVDKPDDLNEIAIYVHGEDDGEFNSGDYILFYGDDPNIYTANLAAEKYDYLINHYSTKTFYLLNISEEDGLRVDTINNDSNNAYPVIDKYLSYGSYEVEKENILKSGRDWWGNRFDSEPSQTFSFAAEGLDINYPVKIESRVLARSYDPCSFSYYLNGQFIEEETMGTIAHPTINRYATKGVLSRKEFDVNLSLSSSNLDMRIDFTKSSSGRSSIGQLDYVYIQFTRDLELLGSQIDFRSFESLSNPNTTFSISQMASDSRIWDISNPLQPQLQSFELDGSIARFGTVTNDLKEFIVFKNSGFLSPSFVSELENQNLHGMAVPDAIFIAHKDVLSSAQRLAEFRKNHDGLDVEVITIDQVFNEYSGGNPDLTAIRNFMKDLYTRSHKLKYLLLMGECSFDYKYILRSALIKSNDNKIPTYESYASLNPTRSYSSDDYFGFLEDGEGGWAEESMHEENHDMEIGVGRIPARDTKDADAIVNKLIAYTDNETVFGDWRNEIYFVADDGDLNSHQRDADNLATYVDAHNPEFNTNKLLLDAYEQIASPAGKYSLEMEEAINEAIYKGGLIVNYSGHGGEFGWAEENILSILTIYGWENERWPLFVTATCEFGRYDDPYLRSGGEVLLLSENAGAIGLITTSRPVYQTSNFMLNSAFYECVFNRIDGEYPRIGDVQRMTKNNSMSGVNNRNFSLLGDPTMKLAYPEEKIVLTKINEDTVGNQTDTLKAMSLIKLGGEIQSGLNQKIEDFEGTLQAVIYDKPKTRFTLGDETGVPPFEYTSWDNILFKGKATVSNGEFELEFYMPKNINYAIGEGKVSLYAQADDYSMDANGAGKDIVIGSTNPNPDEDTNAPNIQLYMDDPSFTNGGITNDDPMLVAFLEDEHGINVSINGIGQNIEATLDADSTFILNRYYSASLDDYTSGWLEFPLQNLSPGMHTISLKAWDTHNNSETAEICFLVTEYDNLSITDLSCFPNPYSQMIHDNIQFSCSHNRAGEDLALQISIVDMQGRMIRQFESEIHNAPATISSLTWDGNTSSGDRIEDGVYLYQIHIQSLKDGAKNSKFEKLVIIN